MEAAVEIFPLRDIDQFIELIQLFAEIFEMENFSLPSEAHLRSVLAKEAFFVFAATYKNRIIGGLTAYTIQQYFAESPIAYIYDLAVKVDFQRQGIGKKLIAAATDFFKTKGYKEVFVQADEEDGYALEFYRSTGGIETKVRHFNYMLDKSYRHNKASIHSAR